MVEDLKLAFRTNILKFQKGGRVNIPRLEVSKEVQKVISTGGKILQQILTWAEEIYLR